MRARICRMICSTSTLSERTEKSDMTCLFHGLAAIAAAGLAGALREELGRLGDARAEDAERAEQRLRARQLNLRGRAANLGVAVGVGPDRLPVAEQAPPRAVQHRLHHPPGVEGIPEAVVVDDARDVGPRRQHRLERPLDRLPPRAPEDLL